MMRAIALYTHYGRLLARGRAATAQPIKNMPKLGRGAQPEWLGKQVLQAAGIRVPGGALARSVEDAVATVENARRVVLRWPAPPAQAPPRYHVERAVVEVYSEDEIVRLRKDTPPLAEPSVGAIKAIGEFVKLTKEPLEATEFIDDAVEATLLAAASERALGEVFNVGTGMETRVNELADMLIRLTGASVQASHTDRRDVDNIRRRVVNIEKTRRSLRWVPEVTLEEGLRRTVEWQRGRLASPAGG